MEMRHEQFSEGALFFQVPSFDLSQLHICCGQSALHEISRRCDTNSEDVNPSHGGRFAVFTSKTCSICKTEKPLSDFSKRKAGNDGYHYYCRACCNERQRAYRKENRERIIERDRQYYRENNDRINSLRQERYANDEDVREKAKTQARKWARENKGRRREKHKEWVAQNKSKMNEYRRRHVRKHIERYRGIWVANSAKRRAVARNAEGNHTVKDIRQQYKAQKGRCYYCNEKVGRDYHVDHVIPISRGGSNGPENIVIACPTCNTTKSDKLPHEWPQGGRLL